MAIEPPHPGNHRDKRHKERDQCAVVRRPAGDGKVTAESDRDAQTRERHAEALQFVKPLAQETNAIEAMLIHGQTVFRGEASKPLAHPIEALPVCLQHVTASPVKAT